MTKQSLLPGILKEEVIAAVTQADASTKFLYKAVERALERGIKEPFDKLLQVMENFDDLALKQLATKIKQEMTMGDNIESESTVDDSGVPQITG